MEGNPDSLTYRIEQALLARHPVTLPPERARNYAEIAASVVADEVSKLRATLDWLHNWNRTVTELQNSDAHQ